MGVVNCSTCRYSAIAIEIPNCEKEELLECHRNAPATLLGGGDDPILSVWWPLVYPEDWCGEHRYIPPDRVMGKE